MLRMNNPLMNKKQKSLNGFTLLEILLAITIFSVVVTIIFGSFNMIFGNVEAVNQTSEAYEMAKSSLSRMTIDLNSIYVSLPPAYSPEQGSGEPDPYGVVGDNGFPGGTDFARLRFSSLAHVSFGIKKEKGIAEIVYYVQQADDNTYVLRRSDNLEPFESFEEKNSDPILCKNIMALTFNYFDKEGETHDSWDSESDEFDYATPGAVRISLLIGNEESSHKFETTIMLPLYREGKKE